ncbi:MAG: thiamine diphosphokinase [Ignavibacteria bacterium]
MKHNKSVIFLNGNPPDNVLRRLKLKDKLLICADGAANYLLEYGIQPDVILGDLDSIKQKVLQVFKKQGVSILKIEEQETTDFEKALLFAKKNFVKEITIVGAISERPDHTLNNFSVMKRYHKVFDIKILDKEFEIYYIKNRTVFNYKKGYVVSFMPMPDARGIITTGLKYALNNETLKFGIREGTLNVASSNRVSISFKKGNLLLFKKHFNKI